jgi:ABC-type nitrate/sulfonate/bicarbonate transport system permease component
MLAWRQARSPAQERARIIDVPEYLAPGVYVEETGYRSKAIEGVSTSTRGFAGFVLGVLLGVAVSLAVGRARRRRRRRVPPTPG